MDRKWARGLGILPTDTAMLLALTAARQASSPTSMAQARLTLPAAPATGGVPPRIALFTASGRSGARGSFDPGAASLIIRSEDENGVYRAG